MSTWTYTAGSGQARDLVRLLITDTDPDNPLLDDEQIDDALVLEDQNVKRAAATCLDAIASSQALVLKVITINGLSTNGPAVAKSLRDHAALLRQEADDQEVDGAFDWAEQTTTVFAERERLWKQYQRGAI